MRGTHGEVLELDMASVADLDAELDAKYGFAFDATSVNPGLEELDAALEESCGAQFEQPKSAGWLLAADAFPEANQKAAYEKERFIGGIAIRGESGELRAETNNESTLMSAIQAAAKGDEDALAVVYNNVSTDVAERLFKSAHQTRIRMHISGGKLQQSGRNLTDLHRNALEHTVLIQPMMRRTTTELKNALLFEELHAKGVLKTHDALVFSPSPTDMSLAQKKDYNFFLDTETCSIQRLSAVGNDVLLESAFVAGKRQPGSQRHDIGAIRSLAAERGVEIATSDGTDLLSYVFLVPKEQISGVEDAVKWYDDASGGTFYGEDKPRQDYKQYAATCEQRSSGFDGMVQEIAAQLIAEAHTFTTALDANMRLDELSEQFSVKRAVEDKTINEAVFGKQAAMHINEARFFMDRGEYDRAEQSLAMAQETADSGSCPWLKSMVRGESDPSDPSGTTSNTQELGEKKRGKCPFCGITVKVDPCAERIVCWDCTAEVNKGRVISAGNGGSNKRKSEPADTEQPLVLVTFNASEVEAVPEEPSQAPTDDNVTAISQQVDAVFEERGIDSFEAEQQKHPVQAHAAHAGKLALAGAEA